jgi:hypothetical protein
VCVCVWRGGGGGDYLCGVARGKDIHDAIEQLAFESDSRQRVHGVRLPEELEKGIQSGVSQQRMCVNNAVDESKMRWQRARVVRHEELGVSHGGFEPSYHPARYHRYCHLLRHSMQRAGGKVAR